MGSVSEALEEFLRAHPGLARDPLAAAISALALEIDSSGNSATAKASCAAAFHKMMVELRGMVPAEKAVDKVDDLQKRRSAKLRKTGTAD